MLVALTRHRLQELPQEIANLLQDLPQEIANPLQRGRDLPKLVRILGHCNLQVGTTPAQTVPRMEAV